MDVIDRMPKFVGASVDPRKALRGLKLLVAGIGSVGARIALHAARCGIGSQPEQIAQGQSAQSQCAGLQKTATRNWSGTAGHRACHEKS